MLKSFLNSEYGILLEHLGFVMLGPDRFYLFVIIDLPKKEDA